MLNGFQWIRSWSKELTVWNFQENWWSTNWLLTITRKLTLTWSFKVHSPFSFTKRFLTILKIVNFKFQVETVEIYWILLKLVRLSSACLSQWLLDDTQWKMPRRYLFDAAYSVMLIWCLPDDSYPMMLAQWCLLDDAYWTMPAQQNRILHTRPHRRWSD